MVIIVGQLRNADVSSDRYTDDVTIALTEKNGSFNGARSEIKIPAKSYELLEEAVVERWLENKKSI